LPDALRFPDKLAQRVLARAYRIGQLPQPDRQDRLATFAAAEVQLLVPLDRTLSEVHQHLAESLRYYMVFYLETADSILVIGREPAFYTSSVLRPLSRPAVGSFAFRASAERLRTANSTLGLDAVSQVASAAQ
jgi:hypothetical protein